MSLGLLASERRETQMWRKLIKYCDQFEENVLAVAYIIMLVILTVQVFSRYVLHYSYRWAEELARYMFIWEIWLGASYGVKQNRLIRIDIFTDKLPKKIGKIYEIFITLINIAFCGFLCYKGIAVVRMISMRGQISGALHLPMQFVYLSVPFCCFLIILRSVVHIIQVVRGDTVYIKEEA